MQRYRDLVLLQAAEGRINPEQLAELLAIARDWTAPAFPLTGYDVTALGIPPGPRVGALLDTVERWWEAADFAPDRSRCVERLKEVRLNFSDPSGRRNLDDAPTPDFDR